MTSNETTGDDAIVIRAGTIAEESAIAEVLFEAIRKSDSPYSEAQRAAWMPEVRSGPEWLKRLGDETIFVAEVRAKLVGVMTLTATGYLDFAFILPSYQKRGVFRRLYQLIEAHAISQGLRRLTVHASLMAHGPFLAVGFAVMQPETVEVRGEKLPRYLMEKELG